MIKYACTLKKILKIEGEKKKKKEKMIPNSPLIGEIFIIY